MQMKDIFNRLISLMGSKNDNAETDLYKELNDFCKSKPGSIKALFTYADEAGRTLLHHALESGKERVFNGVFSLYKIFLKEEWKLLPFIATPAFINSPLFLQTVVPLHATKSEWIKYGARFPFLMAPLVTASAVSVTPQELTTNEILNIQSIPSSVFLRLCLQRLEENNFNVEFLEKLKKYLNHPALRTYWEKAYESIARTLGGGNIPFTIAPGEWLPGKTSFEAVIGLYLFQQYCELLHMKGLHTSESAAPLLKKVDVLMKHLEDIGVLQFQSFHFLNYLCVEMVNNINALQTAAHIGSQNKEVLSSDSIYCLLGLIKKLETFAAPGYLAAACLYLTLGNYFITIKDDKLAKLYYEKSYEALIVAENIPHSARQIEIAFFGKKAEFIYQISSLDAAKKALMPIIRVCMSQSRIDEVENRGKILALGIKRDLGLPENSKKTQSEQVTLMGVEVGPSASRPPILCASTPAVLFAGVKPRNMHKSQSSPNLLTGRMVICAGNRGKSSHEAPNMSSSSKSTKRSSPP
jgi:hypothetical protein